MTEQLSPGARATHYFQNSDYSLAFREYEKLLSSDPTSGYLHAMVALCHLHQNKLAESEDVVQKGIIADPGYAGLYYVACSIRQRNKNSIEAEGYLLKALSIRPHDADYLGLLATIQNGRSEWQLAFESASRGLDHEKDHPVCVKQLALAGKGLQYNMKSQALLKGFLSLWDSVHILVTQTAKKIGHILRK
jgi:tetratricopeptide (TPR) repeat protein